MITPSRLHGFVGTCFPSPLCGSPVGWSGCVSFKLDDVGAAFEGGVDLSAGVDPWSQEADNSRTPNKKPSVYRSCMLFPPLEGQAPLLHSLSSYAGLWRRLLDKALVPSFADGLRQSNHAFLKLRISIRAKFRRRDRVLREPHFLNPSHTCVSRAVKVGDELEKDVR